MDFLRGVGAVALGAFTAWFVPGFVAGALLALGYENGFTYFLGIERLAWVPYLGACLGALAIFIVDKRRPIQGKSTT